MRFSRSCQLQADEFVQETSLDGLETVDARNAIRDGQNTPNLNRDGDGRQFEAQERQNLQRRPGQRKSTAGSYLLHTLVLCEVGDPLRQDLRELRRAHLVNKHNSTHSFKLKISSRVLDAGESRS